MTEKPLFTYQAWLSIHWDSNGAPQWGNADHTVLASDEGHPWSCWACIHTAMVYNLLNKQWFALVSPPPPFKSTRVNTRL